MRLWIGILFAGMLIACTFSLQVLASGSPEASPLQIRLDATDRFLYHVEASDHFPVQSTGRVAVALGGGGARALVNVGVLKALEEAQIPIDFVVGTSMGAIVAVLYGSGIPIEQIEQLVTGVNLPSMFYLNFPFTKSLLNTTEINHFIENVAPYKRLEEFPIPTALLSYDLNAGVRYIATTGPAGQRVGGPYAIPLCFPGEKSGDRFLIDAGVWELTPAGAARALGADVVIATTAYDELPYDNYESPLHSWMRMINLIKENNAREVVEEDADIEIAHDVGDYSFMDFQLAQQFIELGYRETQEQIPAIRALLAEKGIPLRSPVKKTAVNVDSIIKDLAADRMTGQPLIIKPDFSFGKDRGVFAPRLFRNTSYHPRYALDVKWGSLENRFATTGNGGTLWEWDGKWKKLTPNLDLEGRASLEQGNLAWEMGFAYYTDHAQWYLGYGSGQTHLENLYQSQWRGWSLTGETDLWYDFSAMKLTGVTAQEAEIPVTGRFLFHPKFVLRHDAGSLSPQIYRGSSANDDAWFQGTAEWVYDDRFPYSLEVLQLMQVTGITYYSFVDFQSGGRMDWALGGGVAADMNLLGIKPSRVGGNISYEPQTGGFGFHLDLDFTF